MQTNKSIIKTESNMKATELAQVLHTLDCWGMNQDYTIYKVIEGDTAKKAFSSIFEDKPVKQGFYLWVWCNKTEYKALVEMLRLNLGADFKPFIEQKGTSLYHVIIKVED